MYIIPHIGGTMDDLRGKRYVQSSKLYKKYYEENKDSDNLVIKYMPYILKMTAKLAKVNPKHDFEDTLSVVILATAYAASKYEPDKGVEFTTFAKKRINGAVLDYFRDCSPNEAKIKRIILGCIETTYKETGAFPTETQLLKATGMTERALRDFMLDMDNVKLLDIDLFSDSEFASYEIDDEDTTIHDVSTIINTFDSPISDVFRLVFIEEYNTLDVSNILDITQKQVKDILSKETPNLRRRLRENGITL